MGKIKQILLAIPEYLLIAAAVFYWGSAGKTVNPVAISLILILIFQIIVKNRILGLIIPSLLIIISLYMTVALLSELNEFPVFNAEAKKLLFVGLLYIISTVIISGLMIYKYSKTKPIDNIKIEVS